MRFTVTFLVVFSIGFVARAAEHEDRLPPIEGQSWKLVWNDEFSGTKLESRRQNCRTGSWWTMCACTIW